MRSAILGARRRRRSLVLALTGALALSALAGAPVIAQEAAPPSAAQATHQLDFTDQTPGERPTGWSSVWRDSEYLVQDDPARLVHRATTSGRQALSPDVVGEVEGDVEVAALVRGHSTSGTQTVLFLHAGGAAGAEEAYYVDFRGESGAAPRYRINRYRDGTFTTLQWGPNLDAAPVPGVWYQMVLQRSGDAIRFKAWAWGTDEPDEWMIETTDTAHQSGRVGVGHTTGGDTQTEWAYLSTATEGSAPRAPQGIVPTPVLPDAPTIESRPIDQQISVGWDDVEGADTYEVERDGELIASPWALTAYADPLVPAETDATYRVRGVSAVRGPGDWSEPLTVTAPAIAFPDTPTPFEATGGSLTTFDGEQGFLTQIDTMSDRMALEQIGTSVDGRPIQLARIAHPQAPTDDEIRERPTLFVNCTVHGNEWTPRESCLGFIRDLSLTEDPELVEILSEYAVLVNPTANPDGREAGTRENSQGLDVNRDYLALQSPEARAAVGVLNRFQPEVVLDGHNCCNDSIVPNWSQHPNIGADIRESAQALVENALIDGGMTAGYTAQRSTLVTQGNATIARNYTGLRNSVGLLNEVRSGAIAGRLEEATGHPDRTLNLRHRAVSAFDFVLDATLQYLADNGTEITAAIDRATVEAVAGEGPVYVGERDSDLLESPPCGYLLSPEQYDDELAELFATHQIEVVARPDGYFVSMAQAHRGLVPLLLDERATTTVAAGEPRAYCAGGDPRLAPSQELLAELVDDDRLPEPVAARFAARLDTVEAMLTRGNSVRTAQRTIETLIGQVESTRGTGTDPAGVAELAAELRRLLDALED